MAGELSEEEIECLSATRDYILKALNELSDDADPDVIESAHKILANLEMALRRPS